LRLRETSLRVVGQSTLYNSRSHTPRTTDTATVSLIAGVNTQMWLNPVAATALLFRLVLFVHVS